MKSVRIDWNGQFSSFRHSNSELFLCRMLDDMGNEMDCTETKLDATMKKVAKVLHISNGEFHFCHFIYHIYC